MIRTSLRRTMAVLALAGAVALVASLAPVGAHDAGAQHDWNAHLLPLAKDDFFTKKQANARFLNPCEPGTTGAAARLDPSELVEGETTDVSGVASGSAYNCLGEGITVRRDGPGTYTWVVDNDLMVAPEDVLITPVVMGDGVVGHALSGGFAPTGTITFLMTTYRITDDGSGAVRTPFEPPVLGFLLEIAG